MLIELRLIPMLPVHSRLPGNPASPCPSSSWLPLLYPLLSGLSSAGSGLSSMISPPREPNGSGLLFSKHGCIVGQILAHHLIIGEEEEMESWHIQWPVCNSQLQRGKMAEKHLIFGYHNEPGFESSAQLKVMTRPREHQLHNTTA